MGVAYNPRIVTDGLVACYDFGNEKSYPYHPGPRDHGISDWYCFQNTTAVYSAIYPSTQIIEISATGTETVIVSTSSTQPQRGTFSAVAGSRYYGTKAVHILGSDGNSQHTIVPVSFAGTSFANFMPSGRGTFQTYFVYAPIETASVSFYDNSSTGITGIATATATVSAGSTAAFVSINQNTWQYIRSDKPIIASVTGEGWDKSILGPATNYSYNRYAQFYNTVNNNTATTVASGNVVYDTSGKLVINSTIADGSGGDTCNGIGTAYMSNTYSWGDVLSDYGVIAPYANTVIDVSYFTGGGIWSLAERHSLNGTLTSPGYAFRDGNAGFGVAGSTGSGGAANLAGGATLWKFEGNNPFAVVINDAYDDEEVLLGWNSGISTRGTNNSDRRLTDLSLRRNTGILTNFSSGTYNSTSLDRYLSFDGTNQYVGTGKTAGDLGIYDSSYTFEAWVYPTNISGVSGDQVVFGTNGLAVRQGLHLIFRNTNIYQGHFSADYTSGTVSANQWYHIVWTYSKNLSGTNGTARIYKNGVLQPNPGTINSFIGTTEIFLGLWGVNRYFTGRGAQYKIYNRALSASEVLQNYTAQRARYGFFAEPAASTYVTSGLVMYVDAGNTSSYSGSGTTWTDLSGNGNNLTANNSPTWNSSGTASYFSTGATGWFSGNGNSTVPVGNSSYTMIAWVRLSAWNNGKGIISIGGYGTPNQSNALRTGNVNNSIGNFQNYWWNNDIEVLNNDANLALNRWFMVTAQFDGKNRRIWANTTNVGSDVPTMGHTVTSTAIQVAKTVSTEYLNGDIALAFIYDRALTAAEISQNFNAFRGRYGI